MDSIKTAQTNLVLVAPGCEDLPVVLRGPDTGDPMHTVTSYWSFSEEERAAVAAGMPLVISFLGRTHPPVLIRVGDDA